MQAVPLVLHEDYIDNFMEPVVSVNLMLLTCSIQLYSATLKFEAELKGLTYYLYYYPVSMAMVLGFLIFLFMSILSFTIWARWCTRELQERLRLRRRRRTVQQEGEEPQGGQSEQQTEGGGQQRDASQTHVGSVPEDERFPNQPETIQSANVTSEGRQQGESGDRQSTELRQRTLLGPCRS
jgi:hypothetical protein